MEFKKIFGKKPVFRMIHTGKSSDKDMKVPVKFRHIDRNFK